MTQIHPAGARDAAPGQEHLLLVGWRTGSVAAVNSLGCKVTWVVTRARWPPCAPTGSRVNWSPSGTPATPSPSWPVWRGPGSRRTRSRLSAATWSSPS
ncbi:hypothetical protein NKH18_42950 [Streptomyces sp. M10(2022)]